MKVQRSIFQVLVRIFYSKTKTDHSSYTAYRLRLAQLNQRFLEPIRTLATEEKNNATKMLKYFSIAE